MTTQHNFDPKTFFIAAEENFNLDLACTFFVKKSQLGVEERKPITFFLQEPFWLGMKLLTICFNTPILYWLLAQRNNIMQYILGIQTLVLDR